jgi:hypothetical protein
MAAKRKWQEEEADVLNAGLATRTLIGTVTMIDKVIVALSLTEYDSHQLASAAPRLLRGGQRHLRPVLGELLVGGLDRSAESG